MSPSVHWWGSPFLPLLTSRPITSAHPPAMRDDNPNQLPDREADRPYEEGLPLPEGPKGGVLPPGGGKLVLPHFATFSQVVNLASRTYRWTYDEALRASHTNALALRRDPVVMDALRERQLAVAQLPWHIECEDDQDTAQQEAQAGLTKTIERIPRFQQLLMHCQEAIFYGRYGVQPTYSWDFSSGRRQLVVRDHKPLNGDKLVFKYSGQVGVLVHYTYTGTWEPTDRGRAHFLTPDERQHLIVHRWEPEDADFFEGDLAGGVNGVGIRSRIYWLWYLKSQVTAFLMDYLERVGAGGFTIYYYEAGSVQSLADVKDAAERQWRNNAILFPRYRDGAKGGPGVERVEPSQAGAALLQSLITDYFDNGIRRFILGQNLTTESGATGLGSGVADLHGETFSRRVKYDAVALADTLTTDLVAILQRYGYPHVAAPLRFAFDIDKPNAREVLEAAERFWQMGGSVDEDELRQIVGLGKPQAGHAMLAKFQSMSPAAAGSIPQGTPFLGAPGPDAGPGMGGMPPPADPTQQPPVASPDGAAMPPGVM